MSKRAARLSRPSSVPAPSGATSPPVELAGLEQTCAALALERRAAMVREADRQFAGAVQPIVAAHAPAGASVQFQPTEDGRILLHVQAAPADPGAGTASETAG